MTYFFLYVNPLSEQPDACRLYVWNIIYDPEPQNAPRIKQKDENRLIFHPYGLYVIICACSTESELNQRTTLIPEIFTLNFPGIFNPLPLSRLKQQPAYLQS